MNVNGLINFFVKKRGEFNYYEGSISKKDKEGKYEHCAIEVKFPKESPIELTKLTDKECYQLEVTEGFLTFDKWTDLNNKTRRKVVILVTKGEIKKVFPIEESKISKEAKTNINK